MKTTLKRQTLSLVLAGYNMEFGKNNWRQYENGCEKEWLLTNGLGGYSSLTAICSNNRRYHALLVAALKPPVDRIVLLSNVLEDICFEDGTTKSLSSFKISDGYVNKGFEHQQRMTYELLPEFVYSVRDIFIKKKISMVYGKNTTVVSYKVRNSGQKTILKLTPLANMRDHHHLSNRDYLVLNKKIGYRANKDNIKSSNNTYEVIIANKTSPVQLRLYCSEGSYSELNDCYFHRMTYDIEHERGQDYVEDHFIPGFFEIELKPYETKNITFVASAENEYPSCAATVFDDEEKRLNELILKAKVTDPLCKELVLSADNFIVNRKSTQSKTIIAGYPWFTDWGRDTMIAFSGLTLATGRFEDAKDILYTFSKYVDYGLIPNVFPDDGEKPAYNSVDAALWYFEAVNSYLDYTKDREFIREYIYPCLEKISQAFIKGTIYDIGMTEDCLITAGNKNTQLTWMDVKVGNWVVTPRHGKAVEINALWYNALMVMSKLSSLFGKKDIYLSLAEKAKHSFNKVFWNDEKKCLYDVVNYEGCDSSIRPNQILACALSYNVIDRERAKLVVEKVWQCLYTAYGLRTLPIDDTNYRGIYKGDMLSRDGAYHQGTVWTWILGRFIKAFVWVNGETQQARQLAKDFILPFQDHIMDAGLKSISEIFDGNEPHYPRGCFAQAWSVSEILRAAREDAAL